MLLLFLAGAIVMVAHHGFYSYLRFKEVETSTSSFSVSLRDQTRANEIGNALSFLAKTFLSSVIGIAFVQQFWLQLRRNSYTVGQVDAIMGCREHPFSPTAYKAWIKAFFLVVISCLATATVIISVVAPGALKVVSGDFNAAGACTVQTLNIGQNQVPPPTVLALTRTLTSGSYLPPNNPCTTACRYNLTFNAPALNCTNITATYPYWSDFVKSGGTLLTANGAGWDPAYTYNGTVLSSNDRSGIQVLTLDTGSNATQAVECYVHDATYTVTFTHNAPSSTIDIIDTQLHDPVLGNSSAHIFDNANYSIAVAFTQLLEGTLTPDGSVSGQSGLSPLCVSALTTQTPDFAWHWEDMMVGVPSLMANVSISLFNPAVQFYPWSRAATINPFAVYNSSQAVRAVNTTCWYSMQYFDYDPVRLLATYGAALLVTALCAALGFRAVHLNGVEDSMNFSRFLGAILNDQLFAERHELTKETRVKADNDQSGYLTRTYTT